MKDQASRSLPLVQMKQAAIPFIRILNKERVTSKIYDVEGTRVLVTCREFLPKGNKFSANKAIIFFPGWPLRSDSKSIQILCEELANYSGARAYAIHTRNEQVMPNSLYQETKAVCKFLEESEVKEFILVGYSQGGIKAINTIIHLEEISADLHVYGLILIVSVGLNEISSGELARRYIADFLIKSLGVIVAEVARNPSLRKKFRSLVDNLSVAAHACLDFFICILKEAKASNRNYFTRFQNELQEMAKKSPYLDQIRVPIVLVQGAKDRVSDYGRMLTQAKDKASQVGLQDTEAENSHTPSQNTSKPVLTAHIFSQSASIRMIEAEKFGTHVLPLFRSKSVARVSLYLLQRAGRDLNKISH